MAHRATRAGEKSERNAAQAGAAQAGAAQPDGEALRQEIELRAYDRYCQRGCEPGADVTDWLAAEQEVVAQHTGAPVSRAS